MLISLAVGGFPKSGGVGPTEGAESGSAGKRTADASQVGDLLLQAEVSLLKRSADDLSQYHQVPQSTSRSGSRGRSGRSRGREEGWEYSRLSKLRSRDREQLQQDRVAEIAAVNLKYCLMDKHRRGTQSVASVDPPGTPAEFVEGSSSDDDFSDEDDGESEADEEDESSEVELASAKGKGKGKARGK